jgi:hypothetical protein
MAVRVADCATEMIKTGPFPLTPDPTPWPPIRKHSTEAEEPGREESHSLIQSKIWGYLDRQANSLSRDAAQASAWDWESDFSGPENPVYS